MRSVPSLDSPLIFFASLDPTNITVMCIWDGTNAWTMTHILTEQAGLLHCKTTIVFGAGGLLGSVLNGIV
jgi:hypothetical protein